MTKRSRTLLFFTLAIVFFITAPTVIFYSQGYRLNIQTMSFTQVGAFYFDVHPTRAEIYIDGEKITETTRFTGSSLIRDQLPKTHHVEIKKEAYAAWSKNLDVLPQQVTEVKYVTLFPDNIFFTVVQENILDFWVAPNDTDILLQRQNPENSWELILWNTQNNSEHILFKPAISQDKIVNIEWAPDSNAFLAQVFSRKTLESFIQEIDRSALAKIQSNEDSLRFSQTRANPISFLNTETKGVRFAPFSTDYLVYLLPTAKTFTLVQRNYKRGNSHESIARNVTAFTFQDEEIFWIANTGILWKAQQNQLAPTQLSTEPFKLPQTESYSLHILSEQVFLQSQNALYRFHSETQVFEKLYAFPTEIIESPDGQTLAISSRNEITLLPAFSNSKQLSERQSEKVLLTRLSKDITNISWVNAHYLMYDAGDSTLISEIDTRDRINTVEIATFPAIKSFWQTDDSVLYIHAENKIRVSENFWP